MRGQRGSCLSPLSKNSFWAATTDNLNFCPFYKKVKPRNLSKMSGILRGVIVRSTPSVRSMIFQKRGVRVGKAAKPLQSWESFAGLGIISLGCLAVPCWIMTHLEDYKSRD